MATAVCFCSGSVYYDTSIVTKHLYTPTTTVARLEGTLPINTKRVCCYNVPLVWTCDREDVGASVGLILWGYEPRFGVVDFGV